MVDVMVNDHGPFTFLLDTGTSHVLISERLAKKLRLSKTEAKAVLMDALGKAQEHAVVRVRSLRVGEAEFAQLGIHPAALTPETIKDEYYDQWLSFIGQRFAEICLKIKEAVHHLRPGTRFQVYSGYHSRTTQEKYSVDWEAIGRLNAIDVASCGYGRGSARLRNTQEALGDIPLMVGIIINPYRLTEDRPVIIWTKARILRRLTDCTAGVLFYDRHALDGRCYHAVADISRLAADCEEIFLYGRSVGRCGELGEANLPDSAVRESNGKYLVAIMNETGQPRSYSFRLPQTDFTRGTEYYSEQSVQPGQAIELQLQPGDVAVYVLE